MASTFTITTILLLTTVIINTVVITAVPEREYHSMLAALRFRNYHLFANAITTTDLHYDIINGDNFTFFAPIDSALYALDMTLSASDYTTVLRFHCVPHRLTLTDLRTLFYGSNSVTTLVPGHDIHVINPLTLRSPIMIEGVDIAFPGLFYSAHIAVHGLEGVMDFRSLRDTINSSTVASNLTQNHIPMTHAPSHVHRETHAPSPDVSDPVTASIPDVSFAHRISVPGGQRYRQPEAKLESITQLEIKSESVTQPEVESESVTQPEVRSVSISHPRSELISENIQGVSLATRRRRSDDVEDRKMMCCPVTVEDDGQWKVANVCHTDMYAPEIYKAKNMICARE